MKLVYKALPRPVARKVFDIFSKDHPISIVQSGEAVGQFTVLEFQWSKDAEEGDEMVVQLAYMQEKNPGQPYEPATNIELADD